MENFEEIREQLQGRREELISRHRRLREDMRQQPADENARFEDRGSNHELDDLMDTLSEMEVRELQDIDDALVRIERAGYGKCARCGTAIPDERLRAIPTTAFCAPCAEDESRRAKGGA